jgi:hypothetical protein
MAENTVEADMSERVSHLLDLFYAMPEPERQSAVVEILRRSPLGEPDIPDAGLDALADELFAALDAEEAARTTDR